MESLINVNLFGSLSKSKGGPGNHVIHLMIKIPMPIPDVLNVLGIQLQDVSLAMVNYRSVPKDWVVKAGDRLSLFPREYPIFADWLDHRRF